MKIQDIVKLFEFVVQEIDRLNALKRTDWKAASAEIGLNRGLPSNYGDFCKSYYACGKTASRRLYEMATAKLQTMPRLKGRIEVESLLRPIQVELAKRAVAKRAKIDGSLVMAVIKEAETRALLKLEDRTYFFPVYTIGVEGIEEYAWGPVKFIRSRKFFTENEAELKRSEDVVAKGVQTQDAQEGESHQKHISNLFTFAREHYGSYLWIASVEIKGAEPKVGWEKARNILEQSFGLLRLAVRSREGQFIGLVEENPTLRSRSHLSLKATNEFEVSHLSSYGEPHVTFGFMEDYRRKVPQLGNLQAIIIKLQQWAETDKIEDRLLMALFWFNEGWKETQLLPKLIKFSTCVESLFSTSGDHEAIAEKSSERLAWLSFPGPEGWQERRNTYRSMKAVYSARSRAVHGDSSVKEFDLPSLARDAEEHAALAIFSFAQLPPLFHNTKDKEGLLSEFFLRLKLEGLQRARLVFSEA